MEEGIRRGFKRDRRAMASMASRLYGGRESRGRKKGGLTSGIEEAKGGVRDRRYAYLVGMLHVPFGNFV